MNYNNYFFIIVCNIYITNLFFKDIPGFWRKYPYFKDSQMKNAGFFLRIRMRKENL